MAHTRKSALLPSPGTGGAGPLELPSWFRGGLVFKAHRLLHHSTLGLGVIKKKKTDLGRAEGGEERGGLAGLDCQPPPQRRQQGRTGR